MPAPDASREQRPVPASPDPARPDPSATPAFLRRADPPVHREPVERPHRPLELPRPVTPPRVEEQSGPPAIDPTSLPMPSLSRRRVFTVAGVLLAGWLAMSFARQVGEASAASSRAEQLRDTNAALREEIALLETDLARVQDRSYILQQARGVGLGTRNEVPFALEGDAPPLAVDAPGSAGARLGSAGDVVRPLDVWLTVLFGGS